MQPSVRETIEDALGGGFTATTLRPDGNYCWRAAFPEPALDHLGIEDHQDPDADPVDLLLRLNDDGTITISQLPLVPENVEVED